MKYTRYLPPPALQKYVRYFWSFDCFSSDVSVFHVKSFADQYPRLIFQDLNNFKPIRNMHGEALPECYISGIDTQNTESTFGGNFSHFGVSFFPHALHACFKISAFELVNEMPDIQLLCNGGIKYQLAKANSHTERVQLLSAYLYRKIYASKKQELLIQHIIHANEINEDSLIDELPDKYHTSERHLERRFKISVGVSLKKFQRIVKFEKALQLLGDAKYNDLTAIAYQLNYTDQSHFIKDFRTFSGMTPYKFIKTQNFGSESSSFIYTAG
jgi:AraC-like DNA-binding protein